MTTEERITGCLLAAGFRCITVDNRSHPFHSPMLRERLDKLAHYISFGQFDAACFTDEGARIQARAALREWYWFDQTLIALWSDKQIDDLAEELQERSRRCWSTAYGKYRGMVDNPAKRKRAFRQSEILFPTNAPPVPDGPQPDAVYVNKAGDRALTVKAGNVEIWFRVSQAT
jgi:hypothetical protein